MAVDWRLCCSEFNVSFSSWVSNIRKLTNLWTEICPYSGCEWVLYIFRIEWSLRNSKRFENLWSPSLHGVQFWISVGLNRYEAIWLLLMASCDRSSNKKVWILCNKFHNCDANPKTALELLTWIWMHLSLNLINFSEVNLHHTRGKSGMHTCKQETYLKAKKW
jgi:hypothetical protein